jgi:putative transcriptional regulator
MGGKTPTRDPFGPQLGDDRAVNESCKGRLLVAAPTLYDPNFERSVVLVLEHTEEGAVGVVLNRPSETELGSALPGWDHLAATPGVVFVGGPVAHGAAIGLARAVQAGETEAWAPVIDRLGTVDLSLDPHDMDTPVDLVRVFAGYAGWGPGQLEGEIDEGSWLVLRAHPDDALSPDPDNLWRAVLDRQGGRVSWLANFPPDPSMN